jgi:hypothetical protein
LSPRKAQVHQKMVVRLKTYCVFGVEGFIGSYFIERLNLSSFGFILLYWTMMFHYTIF